MGGAGAPQPAEGNKKTADIIMPEEPWARRGDGVCGNLLARVYPERARAILTRRDNGDCRVSVRAPLSTRQGADVLCREFPDGGGRQAAAGINKLPQENYDHFVARFRAIFD